MRLSSVFVFVAFALLAFASSKDDDNRRSNSLSRRLQAPTFRVYHDNWAGMKDVIENGQIVHTIVTFRDRPNPNPITFYPDGSPGQHTGHLFTTLNIGDGVHARDFSSEIDGAKHTQLIFVSVPGSRWRLFHSAVFQPSLNRGNFISLQVNSPFGDTIRYLVLYEGRATVLFYAKFFKDGVWMEGTLPAGHQLTNEHIQWQGAPAQHHNQGR